MKKLLGLRFVRTYCTENGEKPRGRREREGQRDWLVCMCGPDLSPNKNKKDLKFQLGPNL